jgi:hypothetical protein
LAEYAELHIKEVGQLTLHCKRFDTTYSNAAQSQIMLHTLLSSIAWFN